MTATEFETHRPSLLALAYRMLGDFGRAEDVVQDAWLRCQRNGEPIDSTKAWLVKTVTRLCLNELSCARARREESRGDRLPEPIPLEDVGMERVDVLGRISMAFLVVLQRLTPAERAALLLHDVFDFTHGEIANLLHKSEAASRQLVKRARDHVEVEKRALTVSDDEHRRLLRAFLAAASSGHIASLKDLLSEDAVLVADAGPGGGTYGRVKNLPGPLVGREKVAAFVAAVGPQGADGVAISEAALSGQPAIILSRDGKPFTVIMLAAVDGLIRSVFMQADVSRLGRVPTVS